MSSGYERYINNVRLLHCGRLTRLFEEFLRRRPSEMRAFVLDHNTASKNRCLVREVQDGRTQTRQYTYYENPGKNSKCRHDNREIIDGMHSTRNYFLDRKLDLPLNNFKTKAAGFCKRSSETFSLKENRMTVKLSIW